MILLLEPELLNQLIDKYGEEEQLLQASGECGELVAVIQNYLRDNGKCRIRKGVDIGSKETSFGNIIINKFILFLFICLKDET